MKKGIYIIAALLLFLSISFAQEQETKYTNESVAHLSHLTGKIFVQRASDLGYEEGSLNMPISEGDRLGTTDGRAEIHFGQANFIRLDNETKLDVLNLPKKGDDITRLRIWSGNIFLTVGTLRQEKGIEVHTADSSFYILDRGIYRIDVQENRDTEILVFQGLVEAAGEEGSTLVKGSQRLEVAEGRFISKPAPFIAVADDSFDRWNESRTRVASKEMGEQHLPEGLTDYEAELDEYGEWTYLAPYGYVWMPGGVGEDWRPYWNGRWVWIPLSGWTWHPFDPWGWATFHYGRWHWGVGLGWYWIPMDIWGPGWVSWWGGYDYYGWAPMSWWGYPGVLIGGRYYGRYYDGYYPSHSRALTVVHKNQLKAGNVSQVALRGESLNGLKNMNLSSRRLAVRPTGSKISIQPMDGKQVLLRKNTESMGFKPDTRIRRESLNRAKSPSALPRTSTKGISRDIGSKITSRSSAKTGQKASPPKSAKSSGSKTSKGKIKKKDDSASTAFNARSVNGYPSSGLTSKSSVARPKTAFGYPSSPNISRTKIYGDRGASRSGSFLGRAVRSLTGRSSGSSPVRISSSGARISSPGRSSGRISSGSRGSISSSRSSSGSRSGSIRKK